MKIRKVLYISSLPSKKRHFDGERNKSMAILNCLKRLPGLHIDIIDYSKKKYFQAALMLLKVIFKRYDLVFLSKCIMGGSYALHLIFSFAKRTNKDNVVYYIVGNGYEGFDKHKIYFDDIRKCSKLIVESLEVSKQMNDYDINGVLIFASIKRDFDIPILVKEYNGSEPLKAIYFSRIHEGKGVADAIDAIIRVNKKARSLIYQLTIAGGVEKSDRDFVKGIEELCKKHEEIIYLGPSFHVTGEDTYKKLQDFDLHLFPSHYRQECAPGSIVDMFIAGVPTLSSNFDSAKYMMDESNSYFFDMGNLDDFVSKLEQISSNRKELSKKRIESHKQKYKYTEDAFIAFLSENCIIY